MNSSYLGYCEEKLQLIKFLGVENAAKWIGERTLSYGFSSSDAIETYIPFDFWYWTIPTVVIVALNSALILTKKNVQQYGRTFAVMTMLPVSVRAWQLVLIGTRTLMLLLSVKITSSVICVQGVRFTKLSFLLSLRDFIHPG